MSNKEILDQLNMSEGHILYAISHLDRDYRGYDDDMAIVYMIGAINDICSIPGIHERIDIIELKYWKNFIQKVKDEKDRTNALTIAVAYALHYKCKDLIDWAEELNQNN